MSEVVKPPLFRWGVYNRPDNPRLKGQRAMLQVYGHRCLAQFDDQRTGYGHGWHDFELADFDLDPVEP